MGPDCPETGKCNLPNEGANGAQVPLQVGSTPEDWLQGMLGPRVLSGFTHHPCAALTPRLPQPHSAWSAGRGHTTRLPHRDRRTTKPQLPRLHPEPWKDHILPICVCRCVPVTYSTCCLTHTGLGLKYYSFKTL